MEEAEEEVARVAAQKRKVQRELDDQMEQAVSTQRDLDSIKTKMRMGGASDKLRLEGIKPFFNELGCSDESIIRSEMISLVIPTMRLPELDKKPRKIISVVFFLCTKKPFRLSQLFSELVTDKVLLRYLNSRGSECQDYFVFSGSSSTFASLSYLS